ncbi:MAG: C-terminal binding protein [Candidatus Limnocylindria bacterium]
MTAADRLRVVVAGASFASLEPETRALAAIGGTVVDARGLDAAETLELCRGADGVMTDYFRCSAEVIRKLVRCRIICQYGVGLDQIDIAAATRAGIIVTHTPSYSVDELADHALALILAVARNVVRFDRAVRAGTWDYDCAGPMRRLRGRTLGLLGFGRAGRALASRAQALGLEVVATDPAVDDTVFASAGVRRVELPELLARADVLSLHAPLTEDTRRCLGRAELAVLKPGAILVNTARGCLVDQEALADALESGHLAGAGLDVLQEEPPADGERLLALESVVLTPHAGFLSVESLHSVQTQAADEVVRALRGEMPRHAVNPEAQAARKASGVK